MRSIKMAAAGSVLLIAAAAVLDAGTLLAVGSDRKTAVVHALILSAVLFAWAAFRLQRAGRRKAERDAAAHGRKAWLQRDWQSAEPPASEQDQLSLAGMLAAGVAHEIRNPLASLRGFVQLSKPVNPAYTEIMLAEIDRINGIAQELLELAKPKTGRTEPCDLRALLVQVMTLMEAQANLDNVVLSFDDRTFGAAPTICADEAKIKQLFINMIKNGIEAAQGGGFVETALGADGEAAVVTIRDNGGGFAAEALNRLGSPFYTTKTKGSGLGVMIARRIALDHGGTLAFQSEEGTGTTVTVRLPLYIDDGRK